MDKDKLIAGSIVEYKTPQGITYTFDQVELLQDLAASNDVAKIESMIKNNSHLVHARDSDGWQALHIAALQGNLNSVKMLVEIGEADINSLGGPLLEGENNKQILSGGSVLWVSFHYGQLQSDHPVVSFLKSIGAKMILPPKLSQLTKKKNGLL